MTKACERWRQAWGETGAPKDALLLFCGFVLAERWRGWQARENVPKTTPVELGLERTKVKRNRKVISGKGMEKESV